MAHTFRNRNTPAPVRDGEIASGKWRRSLFRCESKSARKEHYSKYRTSVKSSMQHESWEDIPRFRRTSGWLTW